MIDRKYVEKEIIKMQAVKNKLSEFVCENDGYITCIRNKKNKFKYVYNIENNDSSKTRTRRWLNLKNVEDYKLCKSLILNKHAKNEI